MTNKPDVAALVKLVRDIKWVSADRDNMEYTTKVTTWQVDAISSLASELTRLGAENAGLRDAYGREALFSLPEMEELIEERDEAKAEIARLTDYNARLHADIAEIGKDNDNLEAEIDHIRRALNIAKNHVSSKGISAMIVAALNPDTGEKP